MHPRVYERARWQRFDTLDETEPTVVVDPALYREYELAKRLSKRRSVSERATRGPG